jgi:alpha-L-arabinofuranosidase
MVSNDTPGFLSDHQYMQAPGSEKDSTLLLHTVSDPSSSHDWATRAATYRSLLNQTLGAAASGVELLATEYNSVYANPGKQTTSLVNGLFVADSLGSILQTEYNGSMFWDLRNGWDTTNNNSSNLYGWRQGGDYGLLGSSGTAPATGTYVPYPTYFAEQLVSKMVHNGDTVVQSSSDDTNLSVYSVREANGHLDLLVINKNATTDLTGQFQISGFQPSNLAQFWQYGKTQDTAQSQTTDGHSALANFTVTLTLNGSASLQ